MGHRGLGGKKSPSTILANRTFNRSASVGSRRGVESRTRPTMDAVATAAAARSLMTERVDRRRRMVITFQKRRLSNKCLQIIYQEEKTN